MRWLNSTWDTDMAIELKLPALSPKLSGMRKTIGPRLADSKQSVPHCAILFVAF